MSDIEIVANKLVVDGGVVATTGLVKQFLRLDDERLVLVLWGGQYPTGHPLDNAETTSRNVICINTRGEVQWIMENHMDNPYRSNVGSPVSKIELMDRGLFPGHIVAWNGDHRMAIDKDTGKLLGVEFTK